MAVAVSANKTSHSQGSDSATSDSFAVDCTGASDLFLAVVFRNAATSVTATYNGVSMSVCTTGLTSGTGYTCLWTFKLHGPASGSNTLALSWTGGNRSAAVAIPLTGSDNFGTGQSSANTTLNLSDTLSSGDMIIGVVSAPDASSKITLNNTTILKEESTNYIALGTEYATGTGSVSVTGSYINSAYEVNAAVRVIASTASSVNSNFLIFM